MRLIDADALGVGRCSRDVLPADYCAGWNGLIRLLEKAPTVDAVPVVRCKDCKKLGTGECPMEQDYPWISTDSDDFCSYGERRENDEGRN